MENNIYTAPEAELIESSTLEEAASHYVLPQSKLWIYSLLSFGVFLLPWNYLHWRRIKLSEGSDVWPVARAIFSIFFVNSLFNKFEQSKVQAGSEHQWSPGINALFFIVFSVIGNVFDNIYEGASITVDAWYWLLFIAALIIPIINISNAQKVANIASNDSDGVSNSLWTTGNYVWVALCLVFLGLAFIGVFYYEDF